MEFGLTWFRINHIALLFLQSCKDLLIFLIVPSDFSIIVLAGPLCASDLVS